MKLNKNVKLRIRRVERWNAGKIGLQGKKVKIFQVKIFVVGGSDIDVGSYKKYEIIIILKLRP